MVFSILDHFEGRLPNISFMASRDGSSDAQARSSADVWGRTVTIGPQTVALASTTGGGAGQSPVLDANRFGATRKNGRNYGPSSQLT